MATTFFIDKGIWEVEVVPLTWLAGDYKVCTEHAISLSNIHCAPVWVNVFSDWGTGQWYTANPPGHEPKCVWHNPKIFHLPKFIQTYLLLEK